MDAEGVKKLIYTPGGKYRQRIKEKKITLECFLSANRIGCLRWIERQGEDGRSKKQQLKGSPSLVLERNEQPKDFLPLLFLKLCCTIFMHIFFPITSQY
ncbi:hypothetical protein TNIN_369991 [Trichonephila inaurata madagascariensis]|uniref:Uncharacterized protein n=1 Tax=Trichonephila inaurata madagascariensis TaxID=2747483 RepID=A0A8X6X7S9_9ARAC|nr:hypothetical protein TNIN_369991 [Trichonephila inaurata madagascariensis]